MYHNEILVKVLESYRFADVHDFPVNIEGIINRYGYRMVKYSELSELKRSAATTISDDAYKLKNIIYYNDGKSKKRIRFSLAHELGHIVLNHKAPCTDLEEHEANYYASNLLAPRIILHFLRNKCVFTISEFFQLSPEATGYAIRDYDKDFKNTRMTDINNVMLAQILDCNV